MMTARDVIDLYRRLNAVGVAIWIDGGWAVDALLGKETRPHKDLDIAIQQKDVPAMRELLEAREYREVPRDDTSPWNFVLGDYEGREVDVHVIVFDVDGNGLYGPIEKGMMYPVASLTGTGTIDGQTVKCISAEYMVQFKTGYELSEKDYRDVRALCEKYKLEYPDEYKHLKQD